MVFCGFNNIPVEFVHGNWACGGQKHCFVWFVHGNGCSGGQACQLSAESASGLFLYRIAYGYGAIWAEAVLDAEEVADVVLCLCSFRLCLEAWAAVYVHPAAHQVHRCHCKLDECRRYGAVVDPEVGLGIISEDYDGGLRAAEERRAIVSHLRKGVKGIPVLDYHECGTLAVP